MEIKSYWLERKRLPLLFALVQNFLLEAILTVVLLRVHRGLTCYKTTKKETILVTTLE